MKKQITLSGIVKFEYSDNWETVKLVQDDGYKIDLIGRFKEAKESYPNQKVQVSYYFSEKPCTKNEMIEGWLKTISGSINVGFEANSYAYSSWTQGTDYDTNFSIGEHSMLTELRTLENKFLIIEVNFKNP